MRLTIRSKGNERKEEKVKVRGKIVHIGYSATERQIGHIYGGNRITGRQRILEWQRESYDGKAWIFYGEKAR